MSTGSGGPAGPEGLQQRIDSLADRLEELAGDMGQLRYDLYKIRDDLRQEIMAQEAAPPVSPPHVEHPPVVPPVPPRQPVVPVEPKAPPVQKPVSATPSEPPRPSPAAPPAQTVVPVSPPVPVAATPPTVPQSVFVGKSPAAMTPEAAGHSARTQTPAEQAGQSSSVTDLLSSFRNISNLEARMGGAWLAWLGGLCVLLTAAWFFKYSIDQGWINPWMRVSGGWLTCAVLVGLGEWAGRRNMPWFAAGVTGAGLGVGYIASYAASPLLYGLVSVPATYGILSLVTALGLVQAVRLNQLPTAVLALLGGFLTLVLVRTDHPTAAGLLGYLMALNIGALGAGQLRRWPVLRLLAWPGTAILIAIWLLTTHRPGAELAACLSLMPALFVLHQLDMFYWRIRQPADPSYIINTLSGLNCSAILLAVWQVVQEQQVAAIAGTAFFAVAALQAALACALWVLSSAEQNRRVSITFYGQASMAAAVGFPVAFERMLVVAGWAVQAVTLGWLVRYVKAIGLRLKVPALLIACLVYISIYFYEPFMTAGYISVRCWLAGIVALASGVTAYLFALWYTRSSWTLDRVLGEICTALAAIAGVIAGATLLSHEPSLVLWIWLTAGAAACLGLLSYRAAALRMAALMAMALMTATVLVLLGMSDAVHAPDLTVQAHTLGPVSWSLLLPIGVVLSGLAFWNAWLARQTILTQDAGALLDELLSAVATLGLLLVLRDQLADDSPAYAVLAATVVSLVLAILARPWSAPAYWGWSTVTWTVAGGYWLTAATIGQRFTISDIVPQAWTAVLPFANATFAAVLVLAGVAWAVVRALRATDQPEGDARKVCAAGVLLVVAYSLIHAVSFEVDRWFLRAAPPADQVVTYMEAITLTAVWAGFALVYLLISLWRSLRALWWFSLCVGAVAAGKLLLSDTAGQRFVEDGLRRWLSVCAFANPAMLCGLLLVTVAIVAAVAARRARRDTSRSRDSMAAHDAAMAPTPWLTAAEETLAGSALPVIAAYIVVHMLSFEVDRWFLSAAEPGSAVVTYREMILLTMVWAGCALGSLLIGVWLKMRSLWWFGLLVGAAATVKLLAYDTYDYRFADGGGLGAEWLSVQPFSNAVLLSAILLVGLAVTAVIAARRSEWLTADERGLAESLLPVVAGYVLIHVLSFELDRWFQGPGAGRFADLLHAERVGLSVLWALLALAYVVVGLTFTVRSLRLFGLVIFAVTAGKVLLHDMAQAKVVYRMLSAMGLGVLSLIGSFAYQRVRRMGLAKETTDKVAG